MVMVGDRGSVGKWWAGDAGWRQWWGRASGGVVVGCLNYLGVGLERTNPANRTNRETSPSPSPRSSCLPHHHRATTPPRPVPLYVLTNADRP